MVTCKGQALKFLSEEIKANENIVLKALENNPKSLKFSATHLKSNRDFMVKAIEINYLALE